VHLNNLNAPVLNVLSGNAPDLNPRDVRSEFRPQHRLFQVSITSLLNPFRNAERVP